MSDAALIALQRGEVPAEADGRERAFILLAQSLTRDPGASPPAVVAARQAGWADREVAEAIFFVSYFNMLTRIASAFALPPDESHPFPPGATMPLLRCASS